jgi:hypothetical protein
LSGFSSQDKRNSRIQVWHLFFTHWIRLLP